MIKLTPLRLLVRRTDPTLDAIVLFTVLPLLACHGMARGWPAQLGGADGGGRAAAPTRESSTIYHPSSGLESSVPRVDEPAATS